MSFLVGAQVAVVSLRKHGHVLEAMPGNRYRVAIGGMSMVCREGQLVTVSQSKKQQRRDREASARKADSTCPLTAVPEADTSRLQ